MEALTFVPMVAMVALIYKLIDFTRYLVNADRNGVVTQLLVWLAGVVAIVLYAHTNFGTGLVFGGLALHKMNIWAQIVIGLQAGSVASAGKDAIKAIDNHNTAAIPTLLPAGPVAGRHRSTEG